MRRLNLIFIFCFFSAAVIADNLLLNGNFEEGLEHWQFKPRQDGAFLEPLLEHNDLPALGQSALLWRLAEHQNVIVSSSPFVFPDVSREYLVSFKYKCVEFNKAYIQPYIHLLYPPGLSKPAGQSNTIWSTAVNSRTGNINTGWKSCEGRFSLPAGAGFRGIFRLSSSTIASGKILVDDIRVWPAPEQGRDLAAESAEPVVLRGGGCNMLSDWFAKLAGEQDELLLRLEPGQRWTENYTLLEVYNHNVQGHFETSLEYRSEGQAELNAWLVVNPYFNSGRKAEKISLTKTSTAEGWQSLGKSFFAAEQTNSLRFYLSAGSKEAAVLRLRKLRLEPQVQAGSGIRVWKADPGGVNGVYLSGEKILLNYYISNGHREDRRLELDCQLRDYHGQECFSFKKSLELRAMRINQCPFPLELPDEQPGFFTLQLNWSEGNVPRSHQSSFVVQEQPPEPPDPFFGMSCFNPSRPELMRRMGVGTRGVLFQWENCDEEGLAKYDQTVEENLRHMQVIGQISPQGNRKKFGKLIAENLEQGQYPFPEEMYLEAAQMAEKLAKRYHGKIKHWALVEEINLSMRNRAYEKERYVRMAKLLAQALRKGSAEVLVSGIGVSSGDGRNLPRFQIVGDLWSQLKDDLDGIGLDQYSHPGTFGPGYKPANSEDSQIYEIMLAAGQLIKADGKNHLSIDEKGRQLAAGLPLDSEYARSMANIVVREYIVLKSLPELRFWLYHRMMPWRSGNSTEFTMFERQHPRHLVAAYAFAARKLCQARFLKSLAVHEKMPCRLFEKDGMHIISAWLSDTEPDSRASLRFERLPGLNVCDAVGKRLPLSQDDIVELSLGEAPVYMQTTASQEEIERVFASASASLPELSASMELLGRRQLRICLKNLSAEPLQLQLQLSGRDYSRSLELPTEPGMDIIAELGEEAVGPGINDFELMARSQGGHNYKFTDQFELFSLKPLSKPENLSGLEPILDMSDGHRYINNLDYIASGHWSGPDDLSATVCAAYNPEFLFFDIVVVDDEHRNDNGTQTLWRGDAVQIAFDPYRDARKKKNLNVHGYFDDDLMLSAALTEQGAWLYYERSPRAEFHKKAFATDVRRDESTKTTHYRLQLPWAAFPQEFKPETGKIIGFAVCILDRDQNNSIAEYWLQSGPGLAGGQEPALLHGLLIE
ncbi:MAG: sugar-binding protein [Lentisphaeria bacterium]|nr:sugar-binding protein [Lentisphaeria bacterium]MDY0177420.1 sugar-binding protein [Lentisphaeria bacterium]